MTIRGVCPVTFVLLLFGCARPCALPSDAASIARLEGLKGEIPILCQEARASGHQVVLSNRPGSPLGRRIAQLGLRRVDVVIPGTCTVIAWECGLLSTTMEKGFVLVDPGAIPPDPLLPDLEDRRGSDKLLTFAYRKLDQRWYLFRLYEARD